MDKFSKMRPDDIAALLRDEGVQGKPFQLTACPLANFLREKTGLTVAVGGPVYGHKTSARGYVRNLTPMPVQEFVANFDQGRYPFLREEGTDEDQ
jgi:hypothetical protein